MRVVLDTNILVRRVLSPSGRTAEIFRFFQQGAFEPVVSAEILDEYRRVLDYEDLRRRHKLSLDEIEAILRLFAPYLVVAPPIEPMCRDPDDDKFLACAAAGEADYIVSNDPDLTVVGSYQGIRIISSTVLLVLLEQEGGTG